MPLSLLSPEATNEINRQTEILSWTIEQVATLKESMEGWRHLHADTSIDFFKAALLLKARYAPFICVQVQSGIFSTDFQ